MKLLKIIQPTFLFLGLFLGACTAQVQKKETVHMVPPKPISVPVGKNWKVIEEAPNLTDERTNVPAFQTEQSVLPAGESPVVPTTGGGTTVNPNEKRKLETPR